jgi:hypothetical protein
VNDTGAKAAVSAGLRSGFPPALAGFFCKVDYKDDRHNWSGKLLYYSFLPPVKFSSAASFPHQRAAK